jgi:hypothetical protein
MGLMSIFLLVLGIMAGVLCLLAGISFFVRNGLRRRQAELVLEARRMGEEIEASARSVNFFGLTPADGRQWRGNGVLLLTEQTLRFAMLFPKRLLVIPLSSIIAVTEGKSHAGKSKGRRVLKVRFVDPEDVQREAGFLMADMTRWKSLLQKERQS